MFTGDFLFRNSIGRTDLEYSNFNDMIFSLKKIYKYNDEIIVYPGHGRETTLDYEKKNNYYMGVYCEK
jgi:hydroxyacylglutathione hydrolase